MECVRKLKAALATVPLAQPCTAAAVAALSVGGHDAAQQLVPVLSSTPSNLPIDSAVAEACSWQQLPAACIPVLAWVAAGLHGGLPAAAHQQAHEAACVLLGVVSLVVPGSLVERLLQETGTAARQSAEAAALRLLQTLGPFEEVCKQLALVATALVDTVFPTGEATTATTTTTSSSSSSSSSSHAGSGSRSSSRAPELQQVASMATAWQCTAQLWKTVLLVQGQAAVPAMAAALTGSGLYQVLLEGALLLLSLDPAAYSQEPEDDQLTLSGSLGVAVRASITLTRTLGLPILDAWSDAHAVGTKGTGLHVVPPRSSSRSGNRSLKPWMPPLFQLQVLMLAKTQWDVRHGPTQASQPQNPYAWPAKPLARALRHMISPCVAGDLLQQRAPGLVPHGYKTCVPVVDRLTGQVLEGVLEQPYDGIGACDFATCLSSMSHPMRASLQDSMPFDVIGALDLPLLLEATELYCLVCPPAKFVCDYAFMGLQQALDATPRSLLAAFAATSGETLLSIAEYLVADVLLESSGAAGAASGSAAGPQAAGQRSRQSADESQPSSSSSISSSSSNRRPRAGGRNPGITLEHRVKWAQDTVTTIGVLTLRQDKAWSLPPQTGSRDVGGNVSGLMHSLFTATNAPRVSRLLEVVLRTPELQGGRLHHQMSLLPWRLPLLHVAASSTAGSRALLSAVASAAKAQQVGLVVMSALVQAQGNVAPAAAGVAAAVPGRVGQAVAQQVLQQPAITVYVAVDGVLKLADLVSHLMARAAALLDPVLAPWAAYMATTYLTPGQGSKPWALETVLNSIYRRSGPSAIHFDYHEQLAKNPQHMSGIMQDLTAALSLQQEAAVSKQAATLVRKAGGGAEEAEQLRQQLQGMWLGREGDVPAESSTEQQPLVAGYVILTSCAPAGTASSSSTGRTTSDASELPGILQRLCRDKILQLEEVLAAGDPAAWSSALGSPSDADLRVASTALLAACKAAGAVAQLPVLLAQLQPIMAQQPWGRDMARILQRAQTRDAWRAAADWALLLAPLLAVLLPAQQAAELQEAAEDAQRDNVTRKALLTPATIAHVLGLLGHVVVPGAPGCSYPGCCNLEGRSEAELRVQVCTRCRGARYCCREHQVAHWKAGHKEVCKAAQAAVQQVWQSAA